METRETLTLRIRRTVEISRTGNGKRGIENFEPWTY